MRKKNFLQAFIFCLIIGTFLHFTYALSSNLKIVGYFSAVNESIWEHTKLTSFSLLFYSVFLFIKFKGKINNFFIALPLAILSGIILIPTLFYGYYFFVHKSLFLLDITIFIISCFVACLIFFYMINLPKFNTLSQILGFILLILILYYYFKWTYNPPNLKIFMELKNCFNFFDY